MTGRRADVIDYLCSRMQGLYSSEECRHIARMAAAAWSNTDESRFLIEPNEIIEISDLESRAEELAAGCPIQYILGEAEFCGETFAVRSGVLIPRPETEELVMWAIEKSYGLLSPRILDVCTGSGCIAIALAKAFPSAMVFAFDISAEAMAVAQKNAECNHANVSFLIADILREENPAGESYDIIVSNPPCVRDMEKTMMNRNVLDYEPHLALFVPDDDPLIFYRHIAEFATKHLKTGGKLYLEINEALGNETAALLEKQGYRCIVHKDSFGKDRMIEAVKS